MLTLTRKEQLLEAFRDAGRRGLTAAEMEAVVGKMWRLRLRELGADGCFFCETPSKQRRGTTFRWALVSEHVPVAEDDAAPALFAVDEFDPPPPPPAPALFGDPSS